MITDYHASYYAHELSRIGGSGVDRIGRALFDACVELNPHQIEAALFALRSPLSKGVLLADEVGLGKTIEAGLVLCQYWAERKRKILVICPAALRKQWELELVEKFNLPSTVMDAKIYRDYEKKDIPNPFEQDKIVICSMHYASAKMSQLQEIAWDLVVIDEAHKLRNAYRESNRIGQNIRQATDGRKKLLLTATPLQNSLLELYGLSTLIDDRLFGDLPSFKTQYVNYSSNFEDLRDRLKSFCWRSLRSDVTDFVNYTERTLVTRTFKPTDREHDLYEAISAYLQREDTYALPKGQRHLLVLLVRKVLASSPYAVVGTLGIIKKRLKALRDETKENANALELLINDEDINDDLLDEMLQDEEEMSLPDKDSQKSQPEQMVDKPVDIKKLDAEIKELDDYIRWAQSLGYDSKAYELLKAVKVGFEKLAELKAAKKVVIFTESRRTQAWLKDFLESNGYSGQVLTFNGTNKDDATGQIYEEWLENNQDNGRATGSRQIDLRAAIIDRFKEQASILIATEAGAEGLNLQFCSAVINFDLPWNPQRIEQRIGRCHRYGQKHDVVVINFLNERNQADRRVYELLREKFNLFTGIFGASDDVLGSIESGIDFERRVLEIYQNCRTEEAIQIAFEKLQGDMDEKISKTMAETRKKLLDNFDEDVHDVVRVNLQGTQEKLDRIGRMFWFTTKHILNDTADFNDDNFSFDLNRPPLLDVMQGHYYMISKNQEHILGHYLYRLNHPLGEHVINTAKSQSCPPMEVVFDISKHDTRIAVIEALKGKSGWLSLQKLEIKSFDFEEHLLFSALDDNGNNLDQETCEKLFNCFGSTQATDVITEDFQEKLENDRNRHVQAVLAKNLEENNRHFTETRDQLDKWARDQEIAAEKELKDVKKRIQDLDRRSRQAPTMQEQAELESKKVQLERKRRDLRANIFKIEDEIAEKREKLVKDLEKRLEQISSVEPIFTIRWRVI